MINIEFVGAERLLELAQGPELLPVGTKTSRPTVLKICVQALRANLGPISKGLLIRRLGQFELRQGKVYLIDPDYNLLESADLCEWDQIVVQVVI